MIYGAEYLISGCATEARSRAQRRMDKHVGRESWLGTGKALEKLTKRSPPMRRGRGRGGNYKGRYALMVQDSKGRHNLLLSINGDKIDCLQD